MRSFRCTSKLALKKYRVPSVSLKPANTPAADRVKKRMTLAKMKVPVVSVIINSYNYGCYIEDAIESILKQTFPQDDIEIIVIDDGSTDDTAERISTYKGKVNYIRKENGGQASALNRGFDTARGGYIALLDADDFWLPQKIEKIISSFKDSNADVIGHNLYINTGSANSKLFFPYRKVGWIKDYIPSTSGICFKRRCLELLNPIPDSFWISADLFMITMLNLSGLRILFNCEPLAVYRLHGNNLYSGHLTAERIKRQVRTYGMMLGYLKDKDFLKTRGVDTDRFSSRIKGVETAISASIIELKMRQAGGVVKRLRTLSKDLSQVAASKGLVAKLFLAAILSYDNYRMLMGLYHGLRYSTFRSGNG